MELLCIMGKPHNWQATGSGCFQWASGDTGSPMQTNAPYVREEACAVCGATRYMPATPAVPPNAELSGPRPLAAEGSRSNDVLCGRTENG